MQRFKSIISVMQGHSKSNLHWLYNTRLKDDPPLIFNYSKLKFWFGGTSYRTSEKMLLYVQIPGEILDQNMETDTLPHETYLLRVLSPVLSDLSKSYINTDKNVREKAQFEIQTAGPYIIRRSGIFYDAETNAYILRINFNIPLVNALSVNAKGAIRAVRDILDHIEGALDTIDWNELKRYITTYKHQQEIRQYMAENDLCVFVANGSILPRENDSFEPMNNAVPFASPPEMETKILFSDGTDIIGMGIKKGITVITGGGYSGKSTLLNAIEMGIYNHIPGDGREFVLTDSSVLKIYAEDGRPVSELDISPFFKYFPKGISLTKFSTPHASGSVSQAANIIEAVCGKCKLLLIDEDKSANNFMMRDKNMRLIVKNEPIIPFTDRVTELFETKNVSTILVIGGSSEYLSYADTVILIDNYLPRVVTEDVRKLDLSKSAVAEKTAHWTETRWIIPKEDMQEFRLFINVDTENQKKIILDEYSADITLLTALVSGEQLNMLACVMERLLADKAIGDFELMSLAEKYTEQMMRGTDTRLLLPEAAQRYYEDIRPIDVFCCINRMRGLHFREFMGETND